MIAKMDLFQENIIFFTNQNSHHIPFQCKAFPKPDTDITFSNNGNVLL